MSEQRPARPGEVCTCGHPAVLAFVFEDGREVPWCGVERPPPPLEPWEDDD